MSDPTAPVFKQILPAGLEPEGGKAIPHRNLYVCASEVDERDITVRSGINIYERSDSWDVPLMYPTLVSEMNEDGNHIPFSALSGLAAANPLGSGRRRLSHDAPKANSHHSLRGLEGEVPQMDPNDLMVEEDAILYSVEDSFYKRNRIFEIDTVPYPHRITKAMHIMDSDGVFASALGAGPMRDALINDDNTVNIDPEGIAVSHKGGFWLAHEGSGTVGDEAHPVESPNVVFKLSANAVIEEVILLPAEVNDIRVRFGFEGVAEDGDYVVVCFVSFALLCFHFVLLWLCSLSAGDYSISFVSNAHGATSVILALASTTPRRKSGNLSSTPWVNQNLKTAAGLACPTSLHLAAASLWSSSGITKEVWTLQSSVSSQLTWEISPSKTERPSTSAFTWT